MGQRDGCHRITTVTYRISEMSFKRPELALLSFDPDSPADPRPLGEPVLSARDVLAIVYSAFEELGEDDERVTAVKLEVLKAVGEGRVGLAAYRAIVGVGQLRDS